MGGSGEAERASFHVTLSDIDHKGVFNVAALACELDVRIALFGTIGGRASLPLRYDHMDTSGRYGSAEAGDGSMDGNEFWKHSRVKSVGASGAVVEVENKVVRAMTNNATDI